MISFSEMVDACKYAVTGLLRNRRDTAPIDSVAKLADFVASRSAYLAQKTLYGYVKTRMGIRWPAMFEEQPIIASLNVAKMHVFAACLSDLAIYAVATSLHDRAAANDDRSKLALHCYEAGMRENAGAAPEAFSAKDCIEEFERRLRNTDWQGKARLPENFTASPKALYRWAPIAMELKRYDEEIVENSVKFAWRDLREQFNGRIDGAAVYADWVGAIGPG